MTPQMPGPGHAHGHLPSSTSPITSKLHFFNSVMEGGKQIPTYRVIDGAGQPLEGAVVPEVRPRPPFKQARCELFFTQIDEALARRM